MEIFTLNQENDFQKQTSSDGKNMKLRCVRFAGEHDHLYLTIGKIYEGKINRYYDFFSTADNDDEMGNGCSRLSFEWVDGTPEEKKRWDQCEEWGYDGL